MIPLKPCKQAKRSTAHLSITQAKPILQKSLPKNSLNLLCSKLFIICCFWGSFILGLCMTYCPNFNFCLSMNLFQIISISECSNIDILFIAVQFCIWRGIWRRKSSLIRQLVLFGVLERLPFVEMVYTLLYSLC